MRPESQAAAPEAQGPGTRMLWCSCAGSRLLDQWCPEVERLDPWSEAVAVVGVVVHPGSPTKVGDLEGAAAVHCAPLEALSYARDHECDSELSAGVDSNIGAEDVDEEAAQARRSIASVKLRDESKVVAFEEMLNSHGIDTSSWGEEDRSRSVDRLYWEVQEQRRCILTAADPQGGLKRVVRLVKIKVLADIFGVEHALYSRLQISADGKTNERKQLPLRRLAWKSPESQYSADDPNLYAEKCPYTEDWVQGCRRALKDRLGLTYEWQEQHLEEDVRSHTFRAEDNVLSPTYPGLRTVYGVREVVFRVAAPEHPGVRCIGLPSGQEFATTEGNFDASHGSGGAEGIGTQLNIWTWERASPSSPRKRGAAHPIKRVPLPSLCGKVLSGYRTNSRSRSIEFRPPSLALRVAQEGRTTDWEKVRQMSSRIDDPAYTLAAFYADLSAFPELDLYLLDGDVVPAIFKGVPGSPVASSGRTIGDEYQRTVGAFFAIYWLLRLGIDGREGFCFGVDEQYRPIRPDAAEERLYPAEKRLTFFRESHWEQIESLLLDAELVVRDGSGALRINRERVTTVLALTAIHDVMKVQSLLPTVSPAHTNYHGYSAGDMIGDHDQALGYVMDHYPDLLPSYDGLSPEEKASVQFTQCELCFNHGWLVQAEAPPGAVFTRFREVLSRGRKKKAPARDIALYFVHWLTDLAGAEPTPLGGCEKFVIKFPLSVLNSFLRSFRTVQRIAAETETKVMESYLLTRWKEHTPSLGPAPVGGHAIAKMRLLCMAQMNAVPILEAFERLSPEDRALLSAEMALTGCRGQAYSASLVPKGVPLLKCGPALLIYYGPAFLQSLGADDPAVRLQMLALVYRGARDLWPASQAQAGSWVTVRIDMIKALGSADIRGAAAAAGLCWTLVRKNASEAFIDQVQEGSLEAELAKNGDMRSLDFQTMTLVRTL